MPITQPSGTVVITYVDGEDNYQEKQLFASDINAALDDEVVKLTGDQTISGNKTFDSPLIASQIGTSDNKVETLYISNFKATTVEGLINGSLNLVADDNVDINATDDITLLAGDDIHVQPGGGTKWRFRDDGSFSPEVDNSYNMGSLTARPKFLYVHDINIDNNSAVYARNAANDGNLKLLYLDGGDNTIVQSDLGDIQIIALGDDVYLKAADDIHVFPGDTYSWSFVDSGHLYPASNLTFNIGSTDQAVKDIYVKNIKSAAGQRIYITAEDNLYLRSTTNIVLNTVSTDRWLVNSSGHFIPNSDNTYNIGQGDSVVGDLYVHDINSGASDSIYIQADGDLNLRAGDDIVFRTGGVDRFVLDQNGHIRPNADNAYQIGTSSYHLKDVYSGTVKSNTNLYLGRNNGAGYIKIFETSGGFTAIGIGDDIDDKDSGAIIIGGEHYGNLTTSWTTLARYDLQDGQSVCGTVYFTCGKDGINQYCENEVIHFSRHDYATDNTESSESSVYTHVTNPDGIEFRISHGTSAIYFQARNSTGNGTYQANCAVIISSKDI